MHGFDVLEMAQEVSMSDDKRLQLVEEGVEKPFCLLPTRGLRTCSRVFVPGEDGDPMAAKVWHRVDGGGKVRGTITGLMRCGSMLCPVCGSARRRDAAELLERSAVKWMEDGGELVFVTLTTRHHKGDSAQSVYDWVRAGWEAIGRARQVKNEVIGFWRALEWNVGDNGHHAHIHAVAFLKKADDEQGDVVERALAHVPLETKLFEAWKTGVVAAGGRVPSRARAVEVKPVTAMAELASYCNKVTRRVAGGMASEAARSDAKTRGVGRPIMAVMADAAEGWTRATSNYCKIDEGARVAMKRQARRDAYTFQEVCSVMHRKSWIHTPKAKELRELFASVREELEQERSGGADEAMKAKGWELIARISPHQMACVRTLYGISSILSAVLTSPTASAATEEVGLLVAAAVQERDVGTTRAEMMAFFAGKEAAPSWWRAKVA
jgi:hypothetical protein